MSRVLVPLTEAEAHWLAGFLSPESDKSATAEGVKDKVNAALDTDREELEARIAGMLYVETEPVEKHGGDAREMSRRDRDRYLPLARAVLDLLEGGQEA